MFESVKYISKLIQYVRRSKLSRDEILRVQEDNWRSLLRHVKKKSPYYARLMKEQNLSLLTAKPEDFPVLNKQIIHENFNDLVTDPRIRQQDVHAHVLKGNPEDLYLDKYYILKTSGSSGQPGYFVFDADEMIAGITPSIARSPVSIRRWKKRITMLGFPRNFAGSSQTLRFGNQLWIAKRLLEYRPISIQQPFADVVQQMNEFQPHIVSGYAKLLLLLADAQRKGQLQIRPDSIQSGGEQLLDSDRRYLREIFQCPVNNHYGSTEGFSMGICRDGEDSLELFEDHLHFRIEGDQTFITNLQGWTLPLINYQIRDVLIPRDVAEARPFFRVEPVIGRSDEIPYFTTEENGKVTVQPLAFDPVMPEGVKSFFISCPQPNQVIFHLFIDQKYAAQIEGIFDETRMRLKSFFADYGLSNVKFEVIHEEDYGVDTRTGKTQFWRQTLPP